MGLPFNKRLKALARELRSNPTDAESHLWNRLRRRQLHGARFYRQKNIGEYIVDFYCPSGRLIIEIDGGQHYTEMGTWEDAKRDSYLVGLGLTVLRFSNREVLAETDSVLECINDHLRMCESPRRLLKNVLGMPHLRGKETNPPCPPLEKGGKER